jgi:hypothetical protein
MAKTEPELNGREVILIFREKKFRATISKVLEAKNATDDNQIVFDIQEHVGDGEAALIDSGPFVGIAEYHLDPFERDRRP